MGKFIPAHLPGDAYQDQDKHKNLQRVLEQNKNFSHKAFVTAAPLPEKGSHGGWEGTFAARHGGYAHMFESIAPEKSMRWLGNIETQPVNTMPVLVPYPSKSGPGFADRAISGEYRYESEFNYDEVQPAPAPRLCRSARARRPCTAAGGGRRLNGFESAPLKRRCKRLSLSAQGTCPSL